MAETVFAALDYTLGYLQEHDGKMPSDLTGHLGKVLIAYDRSRSHYMLQKQIPALAIERFSQTAADNLVAWLAKQDKKIETNNADFDRWAQELDSGEDPT